MAMKKIIIIVGILLICTAAVVWVYVLMFGAPRSAGEVFSNFGFAGEDADVDVLMEESNTRVDTSANDANGNPQNLRQLTTRPVAGATFTDGFIRYVERGTGHVYEISLTTGNETLLSGTTIPHVTEAKFSPSGIRVVHTVTNTAGHETVLGSIVKNDGGEGAFESASLPANIFEVAFSSTGEEILYLAPSAAGSSGFSLNLQTDAVKKLFDIPLRDVRVLWADDTFVYTAPSAAVTGHVYAVADSTLEYVHKGEPGLMALKGGEGIILSYAEAGSLTSTFMNSSMPLPLSMFPEKCTLNTDTDMICASPLALPEAEYPDDWYKGTVSLSDALWSVDLTTSEAALLSDFLSESGREIDVAQIGSSADGTLIWFINKNDDTLWMYDTTM